MAILDVFKNKKDEDIITEGTNTSTNVKVAKTKSKEYEDAYKILMSPHVTEKSTDFASKNKYIFKVYDTAAKKEIKRAVESIYGVNVLDVKTINVRRQKQRLGKTMGWVKGYKKAIVKIKEGQEIEVLPR